MPKNTVGGGGSYVGHDDIPLNPDAERAVAQGRVPDRDKSAYVGREVTEDEYNDAMSRHGKDEFSTQDKMVVRNWHAQRADELGLDPDSDEYRERVDQITGDAKTGDSKTTGGASSPGKTSSPSSAQREKNDTATSKDRPSTARTTEPSSSKAQTDNSSARLTAGSGKENR